MNKREWLIARGLAKPGRGRLSKAAHDALLQAELDGIEFEDNQDIYIPAPIIPYVKTRDIGDRLVGYTKEGWEVGFTNCRRCSLHANYCQCKELLVPHIVETLDKESERLLYESE